MEILTAEQMREADRIAIEEMRIPGLILMENAGLRVAEVMREQIDGLEHCRTTIVAGRGNNGGDGFVVARQLHQRGYDVQVVLAGCTLEQLTGDAATMAAAWEGLGGRTRVLVDEESFRVGWPRFRRGDVIVDAIFGTGLNRALDGFYADVVDAINASGTFVVAVDLPSGLFASTGVVPGPAVSADLTICFARAKVAAVLPPAESCCGELVVADIGIPGLAVRRSEPHLHWVTPAGAAMLIPERDIEDHKGRFGHVLVVGGSEGQAGAAALTGWSALRAGAGLVSIATPAVVRQEVATFAPEVMTADLAAEAGGTIGPGAARAALSIAGERRCNTLAVGPGLGTKPATQEEIRTLLLESDKPVVLDADGLNAFAGESYAALGEHKAPLLLTPHPGEMARLIGRKTYDVLEARVDVALRVAETVDAVCVLKGYRTITATPDGNAYINPTGNPGMATGGSGDVLTGIIAGLWAQGLEAQEAAIAGVFLHGLAGDLALDGGEHRATLTASAIVDSLPAAFGILLDEEEDEEGEIA